MKHQFKILSLLFFISLCSYSQIETETILSKVYATDKNTTLFINLQGETVTFVKSPDDKLYVDYNIDFKDFSDKKKKEIIDRVSIYTESVNNHITIKNAPKTPSYGRSFLLTNWVYKKRDTLKKKIVQKSRDSLLNEINTIKTYTSFYVEYLKTKYKNDSERREKLMRRYNRSSERKKSHKKNFVIKLPKHISLEIIANGAILKFDDNFDNALSIRLKTGRFYANTLNNANNKIKIENAFVLVNKFHGGVLDFDDVFKSKIVSLKNVEIESELSNLEIGEVGKNVKITDYNSEYFFYNWAKDFTKFSLKSEYSKIHFFYPEANHSLEVVGFNTRNLVGDNEFLVHMQPKSREKHRLMSKPAIPNEESSGHIDFDIVNGIIYSHNDEIKTINKD